MRRFIIASLTVLLFGYAASGLYEVKPEETGVTYVFGAIVNPYVTSGMHWNFPPPIGRQVTLPTRLTQVMEVGYDSEKERDADDRQDLWFTGGTSIVEFKLDLQYSISKPDRFLLSHENPEAYMGLIAERAVTRFFAGQHVDDILTTKRQLLLREVALGIQAELDRYDVGLQVQDMSIVKLSPPSDGGVSNAFRQVQTTRSEREKQIEKARSGAANIRFDAQAEAESMISISKAESYARIESALAEAEAFEAMAKEQAEAPEITRIRLYRDTVPEILENAKLYVVPNEPKLNL